MRECEKALVLDIYELHDSIHYNIRIHVHILEVFCKTWTVHFPCYCLLFISPLSDCMCIGFSLSAKSCLKKLASSISELPTFREIIQV